MNYSVSDTGKIAQVATEDEAYERFTNWGFDTVPISTDDIEHLKSGGWLVFADGEYAHGIYLGVKE